MPTIWARESLSRTRINRIGVAALSITLLGQLVLAVGGMLLRLSPQQCLPLFNVVWAMGASVVLTVERRALPVPLIYVSSFFATISLARSKPALRSGVPLLAARRRRHFVASPTTARTNPGT